MHKNSKKRLKNARFRCPRVFLKKKDLPADIHHQNLVLSDCVARLVNDKPRGHCIGPCKLFEFVSVTDTF